MRRSVKNCMFSFELPCRSNSLNVPARACTLLHNRWSWSRSSCRWALVDLNANLATDGRGSAFEEGCHMFSLTSQKCHAAFSQNFHPRVRSHRRAWVRTMHGTHATLGELKELLNGEEESRYHGWKIWNVKSEDCRAKAVHSHEKFQLDRVFFPSFSDWHSWLWGSKHFPC